MHASRYRAASIRHRTERIREGRTRRGRSIFSSHKERPFPCIAKAFLALAAATGVFLCVANGLASESAAPPSTAQSDWQQGEMPYLYQTDPQWATEPYAEGTIAENGCGPTALSMVSAYLCGAKALSPSEIARFSESNGYVSDGMTTWALMTEGAAQLGLRSSEVPADENVVSGLLASNTPIICSVTPGDFTTTGHFIVLCGLDASGNALVHDPNSATRSTGWPLSRILSQCANLWAFSL